MTKQDVILYSKPNCMQCMFTKKHLDQIGAAYEIRDVSVSEEALEEVRAMGFQSVPVVHAAGMQAFNGFRPDLLEQLI